MVEASLGPKLGKGTGSAGTTFRGIPRKKKVDRDRVESNGNWLFYFSLVPLPLVAQERGRQPSWISVKHSQQDERVGETEAHTTSQCRRESVPSIFNRSYNEDPVGEAALAGEEGRQKGRARGVISYLWIKSNGVWSRRNMIWWKYHA